MRYVGVDLHKTNFVVCFLAGQGKPQLLTFALDAEGIATFCRHLHRDDEVAVEVGQNVYYFYEQIRRKVKRVVFCRCPSLCHRVAVQEENRNRALRQFDHAVHRLVFKWLNRRSQRHSFSWVQFCRYRARYPLPAPSRLVSLLPAWGKTG